VCIETLSLKDTARKRKTARPKVSGLRISFSGERQLIIRMQLKRDMSLNTDWLWNP